VENTGYERLIPASSAVPGSDKAGDRPQFPAKIHFAHPHFGFLC
jgi:hypothetical protein